MNNKNNLTGNELIACLHAEVVHVLLEMTQACFCRKAGIKSRSSLINFIETAELSSTEMMGKMAKGCGAQIKYNFNRG